MADTRASTPWGIMAEFPDPAAVIHAAERVRDAGYTKWDVYAPFPIHGIDVAMGFKASKVGPIVGCAAAAGLSTALLLTLWTSAGPRVPWFEALSGFPMIIGGKPYAAWEQFMPIFFELSVLFSAFGAIFGMIMLNGLPKPYHPLLAKPRFLRVSDDRFIIAIESADPTFNAGSVRRLLADIGGTEIDEVQP